MVTRVSRAGDARNAHAVPTPVPTSGCRRSRQQHPAAATAARDACRGAALPRFAPTTTRRPTAGAHGPARRRSSGARAARSPGDRRRPPLVGVAGRSARPSSRSRRGGAARCPKRQTERRARAAAREPSPRPRSASRLPPARAASSPPTLTSPDRLSQRIAAPLRPPDTAGDQRQPAHPFVVDVAGRRLPLRRGRVDAGGGRTLELPPERRGLLPDEAGAIAEVRSEASLIQIPRKPGAHKRDRSAPFARRLVC
jgi:hypothetical protein